ncbi:Fis family transcriptional regulator [Streptomyces sp. Ru73]|nr:Fis family transcriptional regulator [Streptomyces sp. Ru73]
MAPRLRASWQRSERYGVPADEVQPVYMGSLETDSLLYACGQEVLQQLSTTLAGEPVSFMLTDSEGLVLSRLCDDTAMARSLDRVHLAPGFYFAERNAGTNGLGLALADRAPSLVRAEEHYCTRLRCYTCAAVPVLDPSTGRLAGSVNLTTWSRSSPALLLALAQAAAGNTAALMLARSSGRTVPAQPRGEVFRVYQAGRAEDGDDGPPLSRGWQDAVAEARTALAAGRVVAVVGERGAGKGALAAAARQGLVSRERLLRARPPAAQDVESWLTLWTAELGKAHTCVIVSRVDALPAWTAAELADIFTGLRRPPHGTAAAAGTTGAQPFVLTAEEYDAIPEPVRSLVDTVVEVPPLRLRPDDVLPLAHHFARQRRGRPVCFTRAAADALTAFPWPDNVSQLRRVVRAAAARADTVDLRHLPGEVLADGGHRLTRLQVLERDEIVRCLTEPDATVAGAAARLGVGRATVYRKIAQYGIRVRPRADRPGPDAG